MLSRSRMTKLYTSTVDFWFINLELYLILLEIQYPITSGTKSQFASNSTIVYKIPILDINAPSQAASFLSFDTIATDFRGEIINPKKQIHYQESLELSSAVLQNQRAIAA